MTTTATGHPSAPELARAENVNALDYLQSRGYVQQTSGDDALRYEFFRGAVTAYQGFDPTGPSLHIGHMLGVMVLVTLQRLGHRPIAVMGDGTALVGDPSGKTSTRAMVGHEELVENSYQIDKQFNRFGLEVRRNLTWLGDLQYLPFLRTIGRHFSVNEMLTSSTYRDRLDTGLNFVEFNYQLVQAYDYLHLYRTERCWLQIGGSDQWGNIVAGVDLVRRVEGSKVHALTTPLITTASGEKMGKTGGGNRVWLDPEMTSPYDYYQYWINTADADVERYLYLFTFLPNEVIAALTSKSGAALRDAKRFLAFEATAIAHGDSAANDAERSSQAAFGGGGNDEIPTFEVSAEEWRRARLVDAIVMTGIVGSGNELRRIAKQGGLRIDNNRISVGSIDEPMYSVVGVGGSVVIRVGKKRVVRIRVKSGE